MNIASIGGVVAVPHLLPYTSAKFALVGLSQGLRSELRQGGISVTTVIPGLMRTGSVPHALFKGNKEAERAWFSWGSSFPLISMSAERAARLILRAAAARRAVVTIGAPAKALRLACALFPGIMAGVISWVASLLPKPAQGMPDRLRARQFNQRAS